MHVTEQRARQGAGGTGLLSSLPGQAGLGLLAALRGLPPPPSLSVHCTRPSLPGGDRHPRQHHASGPGPAQCSHSGARLGNKVRLLGSHAGPGGPPQGWTSESVVTSRASRVGPGPGAGADGPGLGPAGTAEAGSRAPGEAGGAGLAVPEAKGARGGAAAAGVCRAGSGPEASAGAGRAAWGPGVAAGVREAVWGPAEKVCGGKTALGFQLIAGAD